MRGMVVVVVALLTGAVATLMVSHGRPGLTPATGSAGNAGCDEVCLSGVQCLGACCPAGPDHTRAFCGSSGACESACAVGMSEGDFADCNGDPGDGCEINTKVDPAHCGGCNVACNVGEVCTNGACIAP